MHPPPRFYLMHGLLVRSELELDAHEAQPSIPDLDIAWGERRPVPAAAPKGRMLARLELPGASSSIALGQAGYTLRVHELCDFELDRDLHKVRVHLAMDADKGLASLLIGGVVAASLALRGHCVLHASAVQTEAGVVAFVGASGSGKTTSAAFCCAAGARLVTDDALRVERGQHHGWCYSGSAELRLRPAAADLAASIASDVRRSTLDQRSAVRPAPAPTGRLALHAIVVPVCIQHSDELQVERLRGTHAVLELLRFPRTLGWLDAEPARRDFAAVADLAELVPVYRALLPWGPPFQPDLGSRLLGELGVRDTILPSP